MSTFEKLKRHNISAPDFRLWAENIVMMSMHNGTAREEISAALEQAFNQGYSTGLNNGWAIEQDKERTGHTHESDGLVYCSNPPQNRCKTCKEFFR